VDYKTDQVTCQTVQARIDFYQQQMSLYRRAVEAVVGQPPVAIHLVFLAPRLIHTF
jgi:ATP-dependent exoDNAse (exonuclease V) beta subunit